MLESSKMLDNELSQGDHIKYFSLAQLKEHNKLESLWVLIHDKIYDVSKFKDEHPGGEEVLMESSGIDATNNFEDVGHSSDARELMKDYCIGELIPEERSSKKQTNKTNDVALDKNSTVTTISSTSNIQNLLIGAAVIGVLSAVIAYFVFGRPSSSSHNKSFGFI